MPIATQTMGAAGATATAASSIGGGTASSNFSAVTLEWYGDGLLREIISSS